MYPLNTIKKEHVIIRKKLTEIERAFNNKNREKIKDLLRDFGSFWAQHEEKEEKFLDWFAQHGGDFPHHKMIITQHKELKGHWKVIQKLLDKGDDLKLEIALDTDGNMIVEKFRRHMNKEEEYFKTYFNKSLG